MLYRAFVTWQRGNCDLVHDPETDLWHSERRETSTTEPPERPDRDAIVLSEAEASEALLRMQQRVWGQQHAAWLSAQRRAAEQAQRELPPVPWDAGALGRWAWANGERLTARLMPPKPYSLATAYAAQLFDLLVYYFAGDEAAFQALGRAMGLPDLSITKGLAFFGPKGVGKTMLLATFAANPVRPYRLISAELVEKVYRAGENGVRQQEQFGGKGGQHLCIDDVCTEEAIVKDYGNPDAPMAKVILGRFRRYQDGLLPRWATHLSSNNPLHRTPDLPKNMPSWEERYGDRAVDRLYELCNIIPFTGESRR